MIVGMKRRPLPNGQRNVKNVSLLMLNARCMISQEGTQIKYIIFRYVWTYVEVLDWDPIQEKFKVRVLDTDVIKYVGRLSVMFLWEDQFKFRERVELSKQRQRNADDESRYLLYIDKQHEKVASSLSVDLKKRILEFSNKRPLPYKYKKEDQKAAPGFPQSPTKSQPLVQYAPPEQSKQENSNIVKLQTDLLAQIERDYTLQMKKCFVVRDMEFNKHDPKWVKLRIRNRFVPQVRKHYGLYVHLNYAMRDYKDPLSRNHYSSKLLVVDTLNMVACRS